MDLKMQYAIILCTGTTKIEGYTKNSSLSTYTRDSMAFSIFFSIELSFMVPYIDLNIPIKHKNPKP